MPWVTCLCAKYSSKGLVCIVLVEAAVAENIDERLKQPMFVFHISGGRNQALQILFTGGHLLAVSSPGGRDQGALWSPF